MEKLPLSKTALETTWLHHEIGRCYLEQKNYQDALECGQRSLTSAEEAQEKVWELNATVLIAQSQGRSVALCGMKKILVCQQVVLELREAAFHTSRNEYSPGFQTFIIVQTFSERGRIYCGFPSNFVQTFCSNFFLRIFFCIFFYFCGFLQKCLKACTREQ